MAFRSLASVVVRLRFRFGVDRSFRFPGCNVLVFRLVMAENRAKMVESSGEGGFWRGYWSDETRVTCSRIVASCLRRWSIMQIKTFTYRQKKKGSYWLEGTDSQQPMDAHIQGLVNTGWEPINSANDPGHVRAGKTLSLGALTGGLSFFFGASRTAPTITLTFKKADD